MFFLFLFTEFHAISILSFSSLIFFFLFLFNRFLFIYLFKLFIQEFHLFSFVLFLSFFFLWVFLFYFLFTFFHLFHFLFFLSFIHFFVSFNHRFFLSFFLSFFFLSSFFVKIRDYFFTFSLFSPFSTPFSHLAFFSISSVNLPFLLLKNTFIQCIFKVISITFIVCFDLYADIK